MKRKINWAQRFNRRFWQFAGAVDYKPGPIFSDGTTARFLQRSVKVIDEDTLEIRNYKMGKRWVWLYVAILVIGGWLYTGPLNYNVPWIPKPIAGLVAPEYYGELAVRSTELKWNSGERYLEPERLERIEEWANAVREERVFGFFMLLAFIGPPLYWLFGPAMRGVRIDRKRNIIYSWSWFTFCIQHPKEPNLWDIESFQSSAGFAGMQHFDRGALIIALPKASNPSRVRHFWLGQSPASCLDQSSVLLQMIAQFLHNKTDPEWLTELRENRSYPKTTSDIMAIIARIHFVPAYWPRSTKRRIDAYAKSVENARKTLRRKANGLE